MRTGLSNAAVSVFIRKFSGENLRCIERVVLEQPQRLNVLAGLNGAGKTSVLEGIHVLGTGRSFRYRRIEPLTRHNTNFFRVVGEIGDEGTVLGVERKLGALTMRVRGNPVTRTSDLAYSLPLLVIRPESYEIFSGLSEERRKALDWAVFHVEPRFAKFHGRYQRALKQRNALLKTHATRTELKPWDVELAASGHEIHEARARFFEYSAKHLQCTVARLVGFDVRVGYEAGWDVSTPLLEVLDKQYPRDAERGTSTKGPHRCDLSFVVDGGAARGLLSRGEGKRLVLALLLSLAGQIMEITRKGPVILVDDLASELDERARETFMEDLSSIECQSFVTTVDQQLIPNRYLESAALFHVKQGNVNRML
ncbi:MAG: DNA replication/repair protein RecF [Gammaproteobacteria bacterium]|nr:DNA replication/repair protein RecF [Gammaproteobacteria bacterium]